VLFHCLFINPELNLEMILLNLKKKIENFYDVGNWILSNINIYLKKSIKCFDFSIWKIHIKISTHNLAELTQMSLSPRSVWRDAWRWNY
jgi:hypothetical protein